MKHTEHNLEIELKPPLSLLLYESGLGTVAIYVSCDWKNRLARALGHLLNKSAWMVSGMAFRPYSPLDATKTLDWEDIKPSEKHKFN